MSTETPAGPPEPPRAAANDLPPLVRWMSEHGWTILVALIAIELGFHAWAVLSR